MYDGQWGYMHHRLCFGYIYFFLNICVCLYLWLMCTVYVCFHIQFIRVTRFLSCCHHPFQATSSLVSTFPTPRLQADHPPLYQNSPPAHRPLHRHWAVLGLHHHRRPGWNPPGFPPNQKSALGRSIKCLVPQQAMVLEQPWSMVDTYNTLVNWGVYQSNPPLHGKKSKCGWSGQIQGWDWGLVAWATANHLKHCLKTGMKNDERNSTNVAAPCATIIRSPGPGILSVSSKRWIGTR